MKTILRVALDSPLYHCFDYLPPEHCTEQDLQPGIRIKVPFGKKSRMGVLLEVAYHSSVDNKKLKSAEAVFDKSPVLTPPILQLAKFASQYYHHPIGEVIFHSLPASLREEREIISVTANPINPYSISTPLLLNEDQKNALKQMTEASGFQTFLLDGVTGSGKTEVYLQMIQKMLTEEKQSLILVPEIGLTPQTLKRFQERFAVPIAVLHSGLSDKQRLHAWLQAKNGLAPIVIGTRSAIFTPMKNAGLIIMDEEHDLSFKQQHGFRYSARDLAVIRSQLENHPLILGSATPSLESLHNVKRKLFQPLRLQQRAGNACKPTFHVVDLRNQKLNGGLSTSVIHAMQQHLKKDGQVLLFLNRRGFAPTLLCHRCGWIANCKHCDAHLILHQQPKRLFCHHCGVIQRVITHCEACQSSELLPLGLGTERLEKNLQEHFPDKEILRIDRDSTRRKGAMQKMLEKIHDAQSHILIGTQMLTKGHHFPNVTLVVIVDVDGSLFSADFRASERLGQLIVQVAGRAGRAEKPGEVYIQTHHPQHPLLLSLLKEDYHHFAEKILQERFAAKLPPYGHFVLIRAEAVSKEMPVKFLEAIMQFIHSHNFSAIQCCGPIPATMERKANKYRWQLWLLSPQRQALQNLLKILTPQLNHLMPPKKIAWSIDVDAQEMF